MNPLSAIQFPQTLPSGPAAASRAAAGTGEVTPMNAPGAQATDFKSLLVEGLQHVNSMQVEADLAVEQIMTGQEANAAEVLTAVQKADLAFRMMLQIRNKMLDAYQEVKDIRI